MEEINKRILLVEDDPNFGTVLKEYLTINNYEVVLAKNGMEGFEKFKKSDFHLCILDVMMPYKDGFTLAQEIREKDKEVPIIFLTAKSLKEEARRFYIAEFGKWSIAVTLFALIFLYVNVTEPLIFFGAFIFSNFITIFFTKLQSSK